MSKTAQTIKMLSYLSSKNVIKVSELATLLETNPRNIIEYKKELEDLGYHILSIPGRYGGYKLDDEVTLPTLKFTTEEKQCIIETLNYCNSKTDYYHKEILNQIISKIIFTNNFEIINDNNVYLSDHNLVSYQKSKSIYNDIKKAINMRMRVDITIDDIKISFNPYKLILSKDVWSVVGWCNDNNSICEYCIDKIDSISFSDESFKVYKFFKINEYLKNNK